MGDTQRISISQMDGQFLFYAQIPSIEHPPEVVLWRRKTYRYIHHNDGLTWQYEETVPFLLHEKNLETV